MSGTEKSTLTNDSQLTLVQVTFAKLNDFIVISLYRWWNCILKAAKNSPKSDVAEYRKKRNIYIFFRVKYVRETF